ncbi:MAG: N-acetylglucosamine-6-phosphate deacetylase [Selenomonadaceae bacterium]|nr:N-acetylglucosamine-6-phosphate deacetylase [Selenomonadaceae bacterium]
MKAVINGKIILPDTKGNFFVDDKILIYDEKIISLENSFADFKVDEIIDAENNFVAPGFINIHIHGCNGHDTMDEDAPALDGMIKFLPSCGVTSFLPTTMTMSVDRIKHALKNIHGKMNHNLRGAKILGAHLEGPFINAKFKGAQDEKFILPADFEIFAEFADVIKIVTIAPEFAAENFIKRCRAENIIVSIGHSAATYEEALTAIERGASHVTHLFNAQTGLHHRKPGIVGAALTSNVIVELIADNVHVHPAAQKIVAKVKPRDEIILITDSIRACGIGDGISELGGQKVFVKGNLATLEDGTLVGSVATMNNVLKNFARNCNLSVAEVVELVTKNPAQELKIFEKVGSISAGKAADFVIVDENFNVKRTIIDGQIAF